VIALERGVSQRCEAARIAAMRYQGDWRLDDGEPVALRRVAALRRFRPLPS
jgi:hypothetical protein